MTKKEYKKMTAEFSNKSKIFKDCLGAFCVGGLICVLGQALSDFYAFLGVESESVGSCVSITLIFLAVLLTGLGVYQKLANIAGAGTLVPITGFANAMSSPALEYKTEGMVLGLGANMFKLAGSVIIYGSLASVIYGTVLMIVKSVSEAV